MEPTKKERQMNRTEVEELARETIPHNFMDFVNTGGGVMNLQFHTMRDHDTAGPILAVGPFHADGSVEMPDTLWVWSESDYIAAGGSLDNEVECHTLAEVGAALTTTLNG